MNTKGTFLASKEAALRIPAGEGGRIVNITTSLVANLFPNFAVYTSSKAAVETFTKIMAKELRVNPLRGGGGQQPLQSLEKFKKYKGGRKRHLMVALSLPKMFMCNHSVLKANSILV